MPDQLTDLINGIKSLDELKQVESVLRRRWDILQRLQAFDWSEGDRVRFDAGNRGRKVGTITKVNQKTAKVKVDGEGQWRVAFGCLSGA